MTCKELDTLNEKLDSKDIYKLVFLSELKSCFQDDREMVTNQDIYRMTEALYEWWIKPDEHIEPRHFVQCFHDAWADDISSNINKLIEEALTRYYW